MKVGIGTLGVIAGTTVWWLESWVLTLLATCRFRIRIWGLTFRA